MPTALVVLFAVPAMILAAGAALCLLAAHRFTRARRAQPRPHPGWADMAGHAVHFPARDQQVRIAAWYLPARPQAAAVVFVHGKDACRGDELKAPTFDLAQQLHAQGFSILMLDLRGHGDSGPARLTYGQREREDVLGAVDWLLARGYAPGAIGLLGASMGGATVLRAAAADAAVGAVIADSAFADFAALMRVQFPRQSRLPGWLLPAVLFAARALTGEWLQRVRPVAAAAQLAGRPLLIVHAEDDPFIPVAHAHQLANAAGCGLWLTPGRSHIASFRADPQRYAERVTSFFGAHLVGRPTQARGAAQPLCAAA